MDAHRSDGYAPSVRSLSVRLEFLGVILCSSVMLLLVLVDSQYVFLQSEGVFNDQFMAVQLLEQLRGPQDSLWAAFSEGRLPTGRFGAPYHGTLLAYLYLPFHAVFGGHWNLARYWCLLLTLASLGFTYGFMRRVYGPAAALTTLFLLVIHPGYVMMLRTGAAFFSPMHLFSCACLYFSALWWDTRRPVFLGLAMAALGIGMSSMLWFGWFAGGMAVAALCLSRRTFTRMGLSDRRSLVRVLVAATTGLLGGSVLLIYREWSGQAHLLQKVSTDVGGGLGEYVRNVPSSWATLSDTWWSFSANPWFGYNLAANGLFPWAVLLALGVLLISTYRGPAGPPRLLLPLVLASMLVQVPLALRATETALFFLYPFPQMVLAAAAACAVRPLLGRRALAPLLACFVLFAAAEIRSMSACVTLFGERVAQGAHLNPVYHLAEWLRASPPPEGTLVFNADDHLEPYLYFLQPERGASFSSALADEVVQGTGGGEDLGVEWTFVYGRPGPRPDVLRPGGTGGSTRADVVAEFNQDRFDALFPVVSLSGSRDQSHFGPPITVYRLRRVPVIELSVPEEEGKPEGERAPSGEAARAEGRPR